MNEHEKYVRDSCVNVEMRESIGPEIYCDGILYGKSSYNAGDTEESAWLDAYNVVRWREKQIEQLEEEIGVLVRIISIRSHIILDRVIERETKLLEEMKKGMKDAASTRKVAQHL